MYMVHIKKLDAGLSSSFNVKGYLKYQKFAVMESCFSPRLV